MMELRSKTTLQRRRANEPYLTSSLVRIARFLTLEQCLRRLFPDQKHVGGKLCQRDCRSWRHSCVPRELRCRCFAGQGRAQGVDHRVRPSHSISQAKSPRMKDDVCPEDHACRFGLSRNVFDDVIDLPFVRFARDWKYSFPALSYRSSHAGIQVSLWASRLATLQCYRNGLRLSFTRYELCECSGDNHRRYGKGLEIFHIIVVQYGSR